MSECIEFTLPFGYVLDDKTYRNGKMHLATTGDELEIQDADEVGLNTRYRDMLLLTKVIDELDGIKPVTLDVIKDLFEPDFIYLQLLYRQLNGEVGSSITTRCPSLITMSRARRCCCAATSTCPRTKRPVPSRMTTASGPHCPPSATCWTRAAPSSPAPIWASLPPLLIPM